MAKHHSRETRVYVHTTDITGQSSSLTQTYARNAPEKTTFSDEGRNHLLDLYEDMWDWEGLFDDNDTAGNEGLDQIVRDLGDSNRFVSLWPAGDDYGIKGYSGIVAPGGSYPFTSRIGEIVAVRHDFKFQGEAARDTYSLIPKTRFTAISTVGSSIDLGASGSDLTWNYHIFDLFSSVTWTLSLSHSSNNSTFATLDTLSVSNRVSGRRDLSSVNRYVRLTATRPSGSSGSSYLVCHASIGN